MEQIPQENPEQVPELRKVNFIPKIDVDEYLMDVNNLSIYDELKEYPFWKNQFKPLDFFNLLYNQLEIIIENKDRPLAVMDHLKSLDLSDHKLLYFLPYLVIRVEADPRLASCHHFIKKQCNELKNKLLANHDFEKFSKFHFGHIKDHLKTLQSDNERLNFMNQISTELKQNRKASPSFRDEYLEDYALEIELLKNRRELEQSEKKKNINNGVETKQIALKTEIKNVGNYELEHRYHAIIYKYQAEAKYIPNVFIPTEIEREFGPKRKQALYTIWNEKGKNYKAPTAKELETILPYLSDYPNAHKAATNDLDQIKNKF